jgi:ribose transport system substrate-binding protein
VALLVVAVGCGASDQSGTESETEGRLFGVSFQTMNNPFFVDLNDGLREVVEANGDRLVTLDAQWNSLKQKNDVSDLILQGAAAIFINRSRTRIWSCVRSRRTTSRPAGLPRRLWRR